MGVGDEVRCCTMRMCCGSTVELSGLNLGSGSFRNVTRYPYRALFVQSDSARK